LSRISVRPLAIKIYVGGALEPAAKMPWIHFRTE